MHKYWAEIYMAINARKDSEYFIAIAQKGIHSFMLLGVVDKDGKPNVLARVGKSNWIDSADDNKLLLTMKMATVGTLAVIEDEIVKRRSTKEEEIHYTAYSINYEQVKEFLALIAEIEKRHYADEDIKAAILELYGDDGLDQVAIECFVPTNESSESDEVTFEFQQLGKSEFIAPVDKKASFLEAGGKELHMTNTCRTTALGIVEAILGFVTTISSYFFIKPDYQTKLVGGNPEKETFYILPPPPNVYKNVSATQLQTMEKLYEKLEELPKSYSDKPETRAKFDALKDVYKSIAGENNLSAGDLLEKLNEHSGKKQALYTARASDPSVFTQIFGSSTKRMFKNIKEDLLV